MENKNHFQKKTAASVFIALLIISGFALLIFQVNFFLLIFAGVFFAVLLNYSAVFITQKLKLNYKISVALVLLFIILIIAGLIMTIGPAINTQVREMIDALPKTFNNVKDKIEATSLGKKIFAELPDNPGDFIKNNNDVVFTIMGSFATTVGAFFNLFVIMVTGIFLALNPSIYKKGFIRLFPISFRARLEEVMDKTSHSLSLWMMAKLISMAVVGISTFIGLQILGVPMPYALALIAALFSFIPNVGPFLSGVPAVLIALLEGFDKALYVVILYSVIQIIESYLITPLIEKKMVALPPALTILWLVLMGLLTGIIGVILAAPILAVLIIIVEEFYVKDYLEKS